MTEPTPDAGLLPVTQADRDAAASTSVLSDHADMLRNGEYDDHPIVQAFARHRLAAQQSASPSGLVEDRYGETAIDRLRDYANHGVMKPQLRADIHSLLALTAPAPADAAEREVERWSAEGTIRAMRSGVDSPSHGKAEDELCICCEGPHVFANRIELEGVEPTWTGQPVTSLQDWSYRLLTAKSGGVPRYDGRRFRVTLEMLPAALNPTTEQEKSNG